MKKIIVLLFVMFASVSIYAQEIFETAAKELVAEMDKVVTLSEAQQKQIYDIELNKNIRRAEIRKENEGNQTAIKEETTKMNKEAYAKMRKVVGGDKMQIWSDYRKEQRAKK